MTVPAIQVESVWLQHGPHVVADGLSFEVGAGRTLAIVGVSGAGKTTLARALSGLHPLSAGTVLVNGEPWNVREGNASSRRESRRSIQLVFQDAPSSFHPGQAIGAQLHEALANLGNDAERASPSERNQRLDALAEACGLAPEKFSLRSGELSGGQSQRAALIRALAPRPALLILDEAFSGLDLPARREMLGMLRGLQRTENFAGLVFTHDWTTVEGLADDVAFLDEGRLFDAMPVERFVESAAHPAARAWLDARSALSLSRTPSTGAS